MSRQESRDAMIDSSLATTFEALDSGRRSGTHSGGQLYVRYRGRLVADVAFGDAAPGEPMRIDHRMLWLSSGKSITAVAIARQWEEGSLDLDDPVERFIPEFGTRGKEAITVRHLLNHTGGIRDIRLGWPKASWGEVLGRICDKRVEPRWVPGQTAGYHRMSSWFVLGEILQRLSGEGISTHLRRTVFEPLAMPDCWIGLPDDLAAGDPTTGDLAVAPLYDTAELPPVEHPWTRGRFLTAPSPGANAVGPIRQLARLYEMLLAGGSLDGVTVLRPQTVEAMTARQRVGLVDRTFQRRLDWGLGFVLDSRHYGAETETYGYGSHCSRRVFGHSGYRSSVAFADPEHRLVVALALNGTPDDKTHRQRFDRLISSIYVDLDLDGGDVSPTA
jgi:CubicO group peptidase (beta-lactamase class C family)